MWGDEREASGRVPCPGAEAERMVETCRDERVLGGAQGPLMDGFFL